MSKDDKNRDIPDESFVDVFLALLLFIALALMPIWGDFVIRSIIDSQQEQINWN